MARAAGRGQRPELTSLAILWLVDPWPSSPPDPFTGYSVEGAFDEMLDARAQPRRPYRRLHKELLKLTPEELWRSKQQADLSFFNQGITFTVYGRKEGTERIFPHDLLPRIVSGADWDTIERGLTQRITALNLFLKDLYHERRILQDGIIPAEVDLHLPALPAPDDRRQGAARRLRQRDGHRSGPPAGRPVRRARRQPARAERRVLHALEPQGDEADLPGAVPEVRRPADRAIQPGAALDAALAGARRAEPIRRSCC